MKLTASLRLAACALGIIAATSTAHAAVEGVWKCKASGNIPIALLTISGNSYDMQAVSDSSWTPKANDSSSGSGGLDIQGNQVLPTSGPLLDIYGAVGSYCSTSDVGCSGESLMLDSTKLVALGCWREG
ncbi:MAG: hypothetical protein LCH46_06305 [Proteobacteria bacterium]|nr:hypothetical protein [Pseudomonadota bacterium]